MITIRDFIFLLIGLSAALTAAWFLLIRKFFNYINNEIEQNDAYRKLAKESYKKANNCTSSDPAACGVKKDDENSGYVSGA